jgi:transketolase
MIGTGSELQLAFGAAEALERGGVPARVVSLPCWELFERQPASYRDSVFPRYVPPRVGVEAGVTLGWDRWVGDAGAIVGLDHYGASAPAGTIFEIRVHGRPRRLARDVLAGRVHGPIPTLDPGHLPAPRGGHPSLGHGDPGVARDGGSDPGHS